MGSVGDCYDNALCESFNATLECELVVQHNFKTQREASLAVFDFIEGWIQSASPTLGPRLSLTQQLRAPDESRGVMSDSQLSAERVNSKHPLYSGRIRRVVMLGKATSAIPGIDCEIATTRDTTQSSVAKSACGDAPVCAAMKPTKRGSSHIATLKRI